VQARSNSTFCEKGTILLDGGWISVCAGIVKMCMKINVLAIGWIKPVLKVFIGSFRLACGKAQHGSVCLEHDVNNGNFQRATMVKD
jgi:hypothetical protein